MNRRFRLATVERLRSTGLDQATATLAAARNRVRAAQETLDALHAAIDACVPPRTATPADLSASAIRRDLLREQAERAAGDLAACEQDAARALAAWHGARSDLRAVEALHDRHREALAEDDARREQRQTDDLAVIAAVRARRATHGRNGSGGWGGRPGGDAA